MCNYLHGIVSLFFHIHQSLKLFGSMFELNSKSLRDLYIRYLKNILTVFSDINS